MHSLKITNLFKPLTSEYHDGAHNGAIHGWTKCHTFDTLAPSDETAADRAIDMCGVSQSQGVVGI